MKTFEVQISLRGNVFFTTINAQDMHSAYLLLGSLYPNGRVISVREMK